MISDFFQTLVIIGSSLTLMWAVQVDFGGPAGLHDALVGAFGEGVVSWRRPLEHELPTRRAARVDPLVALRQD